MAALKYSRQREAIKNYLMSTKAHPSADMVYDHIRKDFPNISLGTVYRNLSLLVEINEAVKVPSADGVDHFDGDTSPHFHFLCTSCGAIIDLELEPDTFEEINALANKHFAGMIEGSNVHFHGKCEKCCGNLH